MAKSGRYRQRKGTDVWEVDEEREEEPFEIITDQFGAYLCPLPVIEWHDDGVNETAHRRVCAAELYLNWSFSIPVSADQDQIPSTDAITLAVTDGWELVCTEGHTIAHSHGEEGASPFAVGDYFSEPS